MKCIGLGQLWDFIKGCADSETTTQIRDHLASNCAHCQAKLDWMHKIIQLTATDDSTELPDWLMARAMQLFAQRGPQPKPKLRERLAAALTFDSFSNPQLAGVRQAGSASRQCVYQAGEWDVDLSLEPGEEPMTIALLGQVLSEDGVKSGIEGTMIHLTEAGTTIASTAADRLGEFTFDRVSGGTYDLIIDLGDQEIEIAGLEVKLSYA